MAEHSIADTAGTSQPAAVGVKLIEQIDLPIQHPTNRVSGSYVGVRAIDINEADEYDRHLFSVEGNFGPFDSAESASLAALHVVWPLEADIAGYEVGEKLFVKDLTSVDIGGNRPMLSMGRFFREFLNVPGRRGPFREFWDAYDRRFWNIAVEVNWRGHSVLTNGWKDFKDHHNLQVGDKVFIFSAFKTEGVIKRQFFMLGFRRKGFQGEHGPMP